MKQKKPRQVRQHRDGSSPVIGWRKISQGREPTRPAQQNSTSRRLSLPGLGLRLIPVFLLLIVIILVAPGLPWETARTIAGWLKPGAPPTPTPPTDPVFIVEEVTSADVQTELPPPNWDMAVAEAFTPEVRYWAEPIARWSITYRIKPNLIATIMQIESCGNPQAVSEAGAQGLFQVMPLHSVGGENLLDPEINARRGLTFFTEMYVAANGDLGLTFAAYNGGPFMLELSPTEWPQETQYYQFWASGIYEETELGLPQSPTLLDWLDAGGAHLCEQAAETLGFSQ